MTKYIALKSFVSPLFIVLALGLCAGFLSCQSIQSSVPEGKKDQPEVPMLAGKSLTYWVLQASGEKRSESVGAIVSALIEGVRQEDFSVKVSSADALATLGADAKPAVPVLLDQLGHEQPWVRVAAMGALASVGKEAVPELLETFKTQTGGPRIRAAFVLGSIGPDAKEAAPIIAEAMKTESAVVQTRFAGILNQIDPMAYPGDLETRLPREQITLDMKPEEGVPAAPAGADWPQFHGPNRDALCPELGLLKEWPEGGLKLLWKLEGLGRGFSTVSISGGRLFTMGDRPLQGGDHEKEAQFVMAYDLQTRKELWATRIGLPFTTGPRCTPTVDGNLVYALGTEGDLVCLEAASGKERWRKNIAGDFDGQIMSIWKYCESPLVDGERLICTPGGKEAMMVALNKETGGLIWKCAVPDLGEKGTDGAAYSSVVIAEIEGVRQYVQLVGRGVIGVEANTGKFLWGYNRIANTIANITHPMVRGRFVFTTTAYSTGSALLKIVRDGDGFRADEVYFLGPREFQNHHGGVVLVGGHAFGGHGGNRGDPTCVELATGKVLWKSRAPAVGSAAVLYADGHLIFRYDRGEVVLLEASPEAMRIKGRFAAIRDEGPAWPHPVIHEGKLYLRHANILACYDLRSYE